MASTNLDLTGTGYDYYYTNMFSGCLIAEALPTFLPATTPACDYYEYMFQDYPSLTTTPELPAAE